MCVILISQRDKPRVTPIMVQNADQANPDGIGACWLDEHATVQWNKGLTVETAMQFAETLPQPYMLHFRLATIGKTTQALTHPFPIYGDISNALVGNTRHGVLMHNGHWDGWEKAFKLRASQRWIQRFLVDKDSWSDSRGMAWLGSRLGYQVFPKIAEAHQKIAIMTPRGITTHGHGWVEVDGVTASNNYFQWTRTNYGYMWNDPEEHTGYAGYLYRTRRRQPVPGVAQEFGTGIGKIPIIETEEDENDPWRDPYGYTYPKTKRLADYTENEWLAREAAMAAEDADWERDRQKLLREM